MGTSDHENELPPLARTEDLATGPGRLRAAMIRAGLQVAKYPHSELVAHVKEKTGREIARTTAHNWFLEGKREIGSAYLFDVAEALEVSPKWLATGAGPITAPAANIPPQAHDAAEAWVALPPEHQVAMLHAMKELKRQLDARRWKPEDGERRRAM